MWPCSVDAVCAIGSTDQSLSVWITTSPKPVVVLSESFGLAVSDLSWHPNGRVLVACSLDGSITVVEVTSSRGVSWRVHRVLILWLSRKLSSLERNLVDRLRQPREQRI